MKSLRHLGLASVFAISAVMGVGVAAAPLVLGATEALPECRYDDVLTEYHAVSEWHISLMDSIFMVPQDYVPSKLVSVSNAGIQGSGRIRKAVIADLRALAQAAREAGQAATCRVVLSELAGAAGAVPSGGPATSAKSAAARASPDRVTRSISWGRRSTSAAVAKASRRGTTPTGRRRAAGSWIKKHAWKYGFLLSYPKRLKATTCYRYEPWHYRYVGREMAADVKATGLTLREYLWKNFHQDCAGVGRPGRCAGVSLLRCRRAARPRRRRDRRRRSSRRSPRPNELMYIVGVGQLGRQRDAQSRRPLGWPRSGRSPSRQRCTGRKASSPSRRDTKPPATLLLSSPSTGKCAYSSERLVVALAGAQVALRLVRDSCSSGCPRRAASRS